MESIRRKLDINPREKANFLSIATFWWTIDLFKKGYSKVLELQDLFRPLDADRSDALGDRLEKQWFASQSGPGRPSLIKAILKTFWWEYTILGFIVIVNDIFIRLAQPIFLGLLLQYFKQDTKVTRQEVFIYAGAIVALNALSVITINQFLLGSFQNGMKVRIAVCSTIYRKALRLSRTALGDTAPGKVVNLLSNDVNRFDIVSVFLHSMWSAPLLTFIVGVLLYLEIGVAGLIGMIVIFIVTPIQAYTGKLTSRFRLQTALRTDERIRLMDEIISGIQVIKLYAWEKPFARLIKHARKLELKIVRKSAYVRGLYMTFLLFTTRTALFCTMMAMVLLGNNLTASKVFVVSSYFAILANTMSAMFVRGIAEIAEALVAMRRLQTFLEFEEKEGERVGAEQKFLKDFGGIGDSSEKQKLIESDTQLPANVAISMKNVTARWGAVKQQVQPKMQSDAKNGSPPVPKIVNTVQQMEEENDETWKTATLSNMNIDFRKGILIGVIGPVGAGKSSLLQAILKELPLESGTIVSKGKFAYVSQEPWVFAGTVRQNILFGLPMERDRYDSVVMACALLRDFEQLPHGDKTIIGERGAALSGGQKARISLARAVYRRADIFLLDDPLSAVDAHVGRHLFDICIGPRGRLGKMKATRILVTHQVHFLKEADWVVVMDEGKVTMQGTPYDLSKNGVDFVELLQKMEEETGDGDSSIVTSGKRSRKDSQTSIRSNASSHRSLDDFTEDELSENEKTAKDRSKSPEQDQHVEQSSKGKVEGSVLLNYIRCGANPCVIVALIILFLATQLAASAADLWVAFWTSQEEQRFYLSSNITDEVAVDRSNSSELLSDEYSFENPLLSTELCMIIHGILVTSIFLFAITRSISFYKTSVHASQNLHDSMFKGCVSTTMRFYDTNPSGRILNRFSKDMGSVDELLPKAILDASQIILSMLGTIIVTVTVNPWFLVPMAFLAVIFMYIRRIYLKTSKNIKRLEGITRSPVFSHLAASLAGLPTIRAFNAQTELVQEFDSHQDIHTAAFYMFIASSTAFGFVLDLLCLVFVFIVVFSFLILDTDVLGDRVGLAITQAMALTGMMQWGIRQSAEVANFMMSVERLLEYRDLQPEKQPEQPRVLSKGWPEAGRIQFKNVTYRYFEGGNTVLKNLDFEISPREKIGIVGRTGAGKSSLIGALFRLAQVEGDILIDGVNTGEITLEKLRSKVAIIPQDPVLFSGTLRRNLDPFEEFPDSDLWSALEQVELKDIANGPLGLQMAVAAGGSNFSVGQRQLICLARAILRSNRILVLDEATANVDPSTDRLIQETIRVKFADCTVLTIAHRLNTIMDSDRVLVMDAGESVEFGTPYDLLQLPVGVFKEMVLATDPVESERLIQIAKQKYETATSE
ncbi:ATP-binding cassette sub-family C member 4-like [Toxorhynchites rutilus septentrionalis]|uniref:ATP-binding cassette sub-family C member 4-like n=1 Tax=Toxorhynchites rutilus septentrionalis TaxID=329112 RepID=UPI00247AF2C4|nr:ATP-binding cassette sub-family C member 4-like [Toxorhynchites rutilus septentrionalis]XP_055636393.1 ATP-binding cassette sub-family C member 4-like [Toxorhynchites rutilus septentrionalis]XP_055636394.1 ATP-binding cassette sub-family C member 4-like [Toxorhynchites rutilus septentrionalis]XP_055636395.1 ATP-binding cassette sub-family C member 4-like [Toxorhynchites rutilus septentrionalis]XP_055636396.1 ATP-binding cassette sub-family C member 4-like [Toxorhynchites rutilus septentriona